MKPSHRPIPSDRTMVLLDDVVEIEVVTRLNHPLPTARVKPEVAKVIAEAIPEAPVVAVSA